MLNKITHGEYSLHFLGKEEREYLCPWALRIVIHLVCPYCKHSGKYIFVAKVSKDLALDSPEFLKPETFHSPSKYEIIRPCPKCGKFFNYKVEKNCKWEEEKFS